MNHRLTLRRAAAAVAPLLACATLPAGPALAVAMHGSPTQKHVYRVSVHRGVLSTGSTVTASATVRNPESKVKSWWSTSAVTTVVRKGINGRYQQPYQSEGYRCTPSVKGAVTSFTCKLQGADVPTTITLTFAVRYRAS